MNKFTNFYCPASNGLLYMRNVPDQYLDTELEKLNPKLCSPDSIIPYGIWSAKE